MGKVFLLKTFMKIPKANVNNFEIRPDTKIRNNHNPSFENSFLAIRGFKTNYTLLLNSISNTRGLKDVVPFHLLTFENPNGLKM